MGTIAVNIHPVYDLLLIEALYTILKTALMVIHLPLVTARKRSFSIVHGRALLSLSLPYLLHHGVLREARLLSAVPPSTPALRLPNKLASAAQMCAALRTVPPDAALRASSAPRQCWLQNMNGLNCSYSICGSLRKVPRPLEPAFWPSNSRKTRV